MPSRARRLFCTACGARVGDAECCPLCGVQNEFRDYEPPRRSEGGGEGATPSLWGSSQWSGGESGGDVPSGGAFDLEPAGDGPGDEERSFSLDSDEWRPRPGGGPGVGTGVADASSAPPEPEAGARAGAAGESFELPAEGSAGRLMPPAAPSERAGGSPGAGRPEEASGLEGVEGRGREGRGGGAVEASRGEAAGEEATFELEGRGGGEDDFATFPLEPSAEDEASRILARLVRRSPPRAGEVHELRAGETSIGTLRADIVLEKSENRAVSRCHARFAIRRLADGSLQATVEDLRSLNGTFLNGRRLAEVEKLSPGDLVKLGDVEFEFVLA